jgi:hypothetical protein
MKTKLIFIIMIFIGPTLFGQSTTILPTGLQNYTIKNASGKGFEHVNGNNSFGTYLTNTNAYFQTNNLLFFSIGPTDEGIMGYTFFTDGNVSSNNYIKLGSDSPAIIFREFSGVTNTLQGAQYVVVTNIPQANVISASLTVDCGPAGYVTQSYTYTSGYLVELRIEDNFIYVNTVAGKSANILNKPFKLLLTIKK